MGEPRRAASGSEILRETRTVAMVGASPNPARASNFVATYLLSQHRSYDVWFVNPNATEILGRPVYPSLADLPGVPDLVDVFRRTRGPARPCSTRCSRCDGVAHVLAPVRAATTRRWPGGPRRPGCTVVMDRCLKIEHARFHGGLHLAGFDTGVITSRRRP